MLTIGSGIIGKSRRRLHRRLTGAVLLLFGLALAGVLAESIGWPAFFVVSTVLALPALVMLWSMRLTLRRLEWVPGAPADD